MILQQRYNAFSFLLLFVLIFLTFACDSRSEFSGIYRTEEIKGASMSELELDDKGEGYWRVGNNEESFSWYRKGNEIRLNTRKGGIIVAKINGDKLEIVLSGGKKLIFRKVK
jgi:hypothetical protein